MNFDFVLFENLYTVENHYKDLGILARLLKGAGYRVAIVDAFKEASLCQVRDIPHISLSLKCPRSFKKPQVYSSNTSGWFNLLRRIQKDFYLFLIIKRLHRLAPNIYLGSMTLATPAFFFYAFCRDTNYFMWALRSSHLLNWKRKQFGLYYFVSKSLYINVKKRDNLKLIISNELIRKEFEEQIGVDPNRLIVRPERIITNKVIVKGKGEKGKSLNLLFIGTLRAFKNVEFCLDALRKLNDPRITYTIAGRCKNDTVYNNKIAQLASGLRNVRRIDRFIPDDEYEVLMGECDFLVLCDKKQASCASNGTMTEALLHGKPLIAPDFNPFKREVEEYGVGYLYKYQDVDSLCSVIIKALESGGEVFVNNLSSYQEAFLENNVVNDIKNQLNRQ